MLCACGDGAVKQCVIEDVVILFTTLCQKHVVVSSYPSDEIRRKNLVVDGYTFGNGSGHRCNCLTDSLLQLLLHFKL